MSIFTWQTNKLPETLNVLYTEQVKGITDLISSNCSTCPLNSLSIGETASIENVSCTCRELRRKLFSFGLVEGATVTLSSKAPLGDPITVEVKGCSVALRNSEAASVLVHVNKK